MEKGARFPAGVWLMAAGGAAALLLFGWFLSVDLASIVGPGDAVVGQAYEALTALALLWCVLLVLVALDRGLGGASWPRRAGFLLVPVAGVAPPLSPRFSRPPLCPPSPPAFPLLV